MLCLSFQRVYRDVLKIFKMLYNQLKIGVCFSWLRSKITLIMFKNVSLCKTEKDIGRAEDLGPLSPSMVSLKRTVLAVCISSAGIRNF